MLGMVAMAALPCGEAMAQGQVRDSVKIYFRQDYSTLDMSIRDNRAVLDSITAKLSSDYLDSVYRIQKILVVGGASPEGTVPHNRRLSANRAKRLFNYLEQYGEVSQHVLAVESAYGQAHNLVARGRHALHLHAPQGPDKKNVGVGMLGAYRVGYRHGGEYVSAGAASAYYYP